MSVGFVNALVEGLRFNSVPVVFQPGWETRGNGYEFINGRPQGLIVHHTGSDYDTGLSILINGRSDLDPPLCNSCTHADGTIRIIAAHPANHAGPAGGPSLGPFAKAGLFNNRVWGNEVMYPGTKPWTAAQYRSVRVLGGVICGILGYKDNEHIRGHYETNGLGFAGKWDPGAGSGSSSFSMDRFRSEVWAALTSSPQHTGEDIMRDFDISGKGRRLLIVPTGSMAKNNRQAWLSAAVEGLKGAGWIQVFAQGTQSGVSDWRWTEKDLVTSPQNLVSRPVRELGSGTVVLVVSWDLTNAPNGGVLMVETVA